MLRIEIAAKGWQTKAFERELRIKILFLLTDMVLKYRELDINRVQFIKPTR